MEVTGFTDYRDYLRAIFESKKKANRRFSCRRFSAIVGFKSPNYLQMILDGKRNLSADTAATIASRLKVSAGERDYFVALVKQANAVTDIERNGAERARLAALKKIVSREIPSAHKEIYGKWFYLLVRELFLLKESRSDVDWIRQKLGETISSTEAANAVELLVRTGLLTPTDKGYRPADPVVESNEQQLQAALMRAFHADTFRMWANNLDKLSPAEQELCVLNIPISSSKVLELRKRIRQFQDEIIGWVQDDKDADRVVQLGTYLIPFP
jgi:uncharacterized protein (TIGR02147 family)